MHLTRLLLALTVVGLAVNSGLAEVPLNRLTEAEQRSGWKLIFDGQTTDGWRNYRGESVGKGWQIKEGALVRADQGAGDIITKNKYRNFELSLEYNISPGGNSGVMFHVTEDNPQPWHSGPEVQIQDNVEGRDPQKSGWLYQLYKPEKPNWVKQVERQSGLPSPDETDATRPAGQWNHLYLRVAQNLCEVAVNGVSYFTFKLGTDDWNQRVAQSKFARFPNFAKAGEGHICLQDHGNLVSFRNIKIRELPADGTVPDPVDGKLALRGVPAFPKLKWEGWDGVDESGRVQPLRPIVLTHANDGTNRVFVATQRGVIYVFENSPESTEAKIFLDIRPKVHDWRRDNEEGLLGLAFHPRFKENGEFFVYYSAENPLRTSVVSRFRVSANDPDKADPTEDVILKIEQPFANHNGGSIAFGHDGYLYIGLGDGGSRNDPLGHGQNLSTLLGSMLRIDVDHKAAGLNYAIPKDNPFVNQEGARPEIFAYGFRNIWRLSVDRDTGTIWVGDVGQDLWEEVHIVERGGNYGWSAREGSYGFDKRDPIGSRPIDPVWEYDHQVGKSITGGYVYRGSRLPELQGMYLYADYVTGRVWALKYDEQAKRVEKNLSIASSGIPVLAFGEDQHGEVYYMLETVDGRGIYRFERTE